MKRIYAVFLSIAILAVGSGFIFKATAQTEKVSDEQNLVSTSLVISQLYGGGGSANALFANDFVEIFNRGTSPVSLNGWSTQYASATGTEFLVTPLSNVTLQPGQYYLIQYASSGAVGTPLTPDVIAPAVTNNAGATFIPNLSGTTGKLALVNSTTRLPASTCPSSDPSIVDFIGYGASASCSEGTKTGDLSVTTAAKRNGDGCIDTDNNVSDFTIVAPNPRNLASPIGSCNLGGTLQASGSANPITVAPNAATLLRVSVVPATTPASTSITVTGNLSNIGGSATQTFFDNGTNGDVTPNDNIFSYSYTIPAAQAGGTFGLTAAATDAQARTANVSFNVTIAAQPANDNPLIFGNPSNAAVDVNLPLNYLMIKPQYSLSYNRDKGEPNWVAWRLDSTWVGSAPRQDDFRPDPDLPAGWYQVQTTDYTGGGYDRGHMCPSGDRTRSVPDNSATFLMTNFLPQLAANNQGPWEDFESYCRTLASGGNEIYITSGGIGNMGTVNNAGKVVIPQYTWKVAIVLPNGDNDLQRVSKSTRTIALIVPNFIGTGLNINDVWRKYRTSVDSIENLTGYNFFSNIPINTQSIIERRRDWQ
jgi:endonuclease G, mitochondrial